MGKARTVKDPQEDDGWGRQQGMWEFCATVFCSSLHKPGILPKSKFWKFYLVKKIPLTAIYQMPSRTIWISAVLDVGLQLPSLNSWLSAMVRSPRRLPALLAAGWVPWCSCCWHAASSKERNYMANKSKSQRKFESKFKGPRPARAHHWIASLAARGGGGGGWGQEQVHRQGLCRKQPSLRHESCDFFYICIMKWIFTRKN